MARRAGKRDILLLQTPIGTLSIHAGMHITYRDLNSNGMPDPGEITAQFEYFRLRCG
jgi:hypothetical protein